MFHLKILIIMVVWFLNRNMFVLGELKQVHCVFRHGERTTDITVDTTYPKDPFKNETYYPYGPGELTNEGKRREYFVGEYLRNKYNGSWGFYTPGVLDAVTTDTSRTKMSLQLVLAALYEPKNSILQWNKNLNWQPVPYRYLPMDKDDILGLSLQFCDYYIKQYKVYMKSPSALLTELKYNQLFRYLTRHTGKVVNTTSWVYPLYFTLLTQQEWHLRLPEWTDLVFPQQMEEATIDFYLSTSATPVLKQLSGGFFVKKIIKDMRAKIKENIVPKNRKMFLYSGHEINIVYILSALDVYFPHVPPYGSFILIELHEIDGVHGVKMFYQDYKADDPKPLKVPGCAMFCPMEQFALLLRKSIPVQDKANACAVKSPFVSKESITRDEVVTSSNVHEVVKEHEVMNL